MLHGLNILPHLVDKAIQHSRMCGHSIAVAPIKAKVILGIRKIESKGPVFIGRRETAVPFFYLNRCCQHCADALRPILCNDLFGGPFVQTEAVKVF